MPKVAIIGTGTIAPAYMQALRWGNENRRFVLDPVAAVNRTEVGNARATSMGIENTYLDIDAMIDKEKPDGLICTVGTSEISNVMEQLIPLGIPILVEKPPGLSVSETVKLAELASTSNTNVMVAFNRRFYSVVEQALSYVAASGGLLGMRFDGFERYRHLRENGFSNQFLEGLFSTNTIHCIDLIRHYAGDVLDVAAFHHMQNDVEPFNHRYAALITTKSQVPVTFQAYWHALGNWRYELYVPDGNIQFVNLEEGSLRHRNGDIQAFVPAQEDIEAKPGFVRMLHYFYEQLIGASSRYNGKHSLFDAIKTMELIEKIKG